MTCEPPVQDKKNPTSHFEKWGLWLLLFHLSALIKRSMSLDRPFQSFMPCTFEKILAGFYRDGSLLSTLFLSPLSVSAFFPDFFGHRQVFLRGTAPLLSLGISEQFVPAMRPLCRAKRFSGNR
jgi:hypothetical protein